jgi:signal transduction histidine kinase
VLQIKHELRNIFGIIMGNCELGASAPEPRHIARISAAAARAFALMESDAVAEPKLDFSQSIDINVIVTEVAEMLRSVLVASNKVRLVLELAPSLPQIIGSPSWLFQSILNLCLNGRDAMLPKGGVLRIATRAEKASIVVVVSDLGEGMSAQRLRTLWKARLSPDLKHGHGLQIVRTTVTRMKGKIDVESKVGIGTTFTISLPAVLV